MAGDSPDSFDKYINEPQTEKQKTNAVEDHTALYQGMLDEHEYGMIPQPLSEMLFRFLPDVLALTCRRRKPGCQGRGLEL
jgi:hypothetical protein